MVSRPEAYHTDRPIGSARPTGFLRYFEACPSARGYAGPPAFSVFRDRVFCLWFLANSPRKELVWAFSGKSTVRSYCLNVRLIPASDTKADVCYRDGPQGDIAAARPARLRRRHFSNLGSS